MAIKRKGTAFQFYIDLSRQQVMIRWLTSQRKSYSLKVISSDLVELRTPLGTTLQQAKSMVEKHRDWLERKTTHMIHKGPLVAVGEGSHGVYFRGQRYQLLMETQPGRPSATLICEDQNNRFRLISPQPSLVEAEFYLSQFYRQRAEEMVQLSLSHFLSEDTFKPSRILIKDQKARWGSCNQKGEIRLNFRIAQCSQTLCDYLVLHELCHLKLMNHSQSYWQFLEELMPDYKARRKALRQYPADRLIMNL